MKTFAKLLPLVVIVCLFGVMAVTAANEPTDLNAPPPGKAFPNTLTEKSSLKEHLKWKEEFYKWAKEGGMITTHSGDSTRGAEINVRGMSVKLPEDAFIESLVTEAYGALEEDLPFYVIRRGEAVIMIVIKTGKVLKIIDEDERSFNFLSSVIQSELKEAK